MAAGAILVTGGAGFIGGRTAGRLSASGRKIVALDLPGRSFDHLSGSPTAIETREVDIADESSLRRALSGLRVEAVVHCAALMGSGGDPAAYRRVNVEGTRHLAAWAASLPVARFVYISSVTVYGMPARPAIAEETPFLSVGLPYADSKIEAETMLRRMQAAGLPCTILRPGDVYGPRAGEWVVKLVDAMRAGRMVLIGGGAGLVNATYVDNLVDAVEAAIAVPAAAGRDYIVTDGAPVTWKRYLEALAEAAGCRPPRISIPRAAAGPLVLAMEAAGRLTGWRPPLSRLGLRLLTARCGYSIERARRELGWSPRVDLAAGMAEVGRWLRSAPG